MKGEAMAQYADSASVHTLCPSQLECVAYMGYACYYYHTYISSTSFENRHKLAKCGYPVSYMCGVLCSLSMEKNIYGMSATTTTHKDIRICIYIYCIFLFLLQPIRLKPQHGPLSSAPYLVMTEAAVSKEGKQDLMDLLNDLIEVEQRRLLTFSKTLIAARDAELQAWGHAPCGEQPVVSSEWTEAEEKEMNQLLAEHTREDAKRRKLKAEVDG